MVPPPLPRGRPGPGPPAPGRSPRPARPRAAPPARRREHRPPRARPPPPHWPPPGRMQMSRQRRPPIGRSPGYANEALGDAHAALSHGDSGGSRAGAALARRGHGGEGSTHRAPTGHPQGTPPAGSTARAPTGQPQSTPPPGSTARASTDHPSCGEHRPGTHRAATEHPCCGEHRPGTHRAATEHPCCGEHRPGTHRAPTGHPSSGEHRPGTHRAPARGEHRPGTKRPQRPPLGFLGQPRTALLTGWEQWPPPRPERCLYVRRGSPSLAGLPGPGSCPSAATAGGTEGRRGPGGCKARPGAAGRSGVSRQVTATCDSPPVTAPRVTCPRPGRRALNSEGAEPPGPQQRERRCRFGSPQGWPQRRAPCGAVSHGTCEYLPGGGLRDRGVMPCWDEGQPRWSLRAGPAAGTAPCGRPAAPELLRGPCGGAGPGRSPPAARGRARRRGGFAGRRGPSGPSRGAAAARAPGRTGRLLALSF
ncbi:collagen alpha-1(I) chain-like [Motacilla alba alba]|uniref:collagen alpha-1(I) chain-like n=1 Tax=Motacilla alba alba TaxID=1094192 RepID=UPI0018D4F08D|nr:collagen alpha-1(I) chain-like [Motacilla alba alba]